MATLEESSSALVDLEERPFQTHEIPLGRIDLDALKVICRLQRFGHTAYLVGGCVRDLLLGFRPKDFDVATSAQPQEIRKLFRNCRIIGRRFRLAHIIFRGKIIETATFRAAQGCEQDEDLLIRSDNVFGTESEDARRRDFTVNALFYDPVARRLIDHVGGLEDIRARRLRFIGDPAVRVCEDPVRILRAVRLSAKLGLEIEPPTLQALAQHGGLLQKSAPPRLLEELVRLLRSGGAQRGFFMLWKLGTLEFLLPEVKTYLARSPQRDELRHPGAALWALLRAVDGTERELVGNPVLLACLLLPVVEDALAAPSSYGLPVGLRAHGEAARLLLRRWVEKLRLPRWQSERIQQLIAMQRKFGFLRPKSPLPHRLTQRAYFPEALDLFWRVVRATGRGRRVFDRLVHLARSQNPRNSKPRRPSRENRRPPDEPATITERAEEKPCE